jgi:hypothetical protein
VLNSNGLGMLMIALPRCSRRCNASRPQNLRSGEEQLSPLVFVWGCLWWLALGITETDRHVPDRWLATAGLLFLAGSAIAFSVASRGSLADRALAGAAAVAVHGRARGDRAGHPFRAAAGSRGRCARPFTTGCCAGTDDDEQGRRAQLARRRPRGTLC